MFKYNKVSIEDNKLIVDFEIEDKPYYSGIIIKGLRIDTSATYGTKTPYYTSPYSGILHFEIPLSNTKELYFIIPQAQITLPPDIPCGADEVNIAVAYNKKTLMQKGWGYLKELSNSCGIPKGFIDFILRIKALDMSIETCNYTEAIKYWEMLNKMPTRTSTNNCGCHGNN